MTRFAKSLRVLYWEEPIFDGSARPQLHETLSPEGVHVVTPMLPNGLSAAEVDAALRTLLDGRLQSERRPLALWYYTPMMLSFSDHLEAAATVYDCMDELANFLGAPPALKALEQQLMRRADVVFTGGYSLYEAKQNLHPNIHPFPSSVDRAHFAAARGQRPEPADLTGIPHPRLGFYGVVDERMDIDLLAAVADARPDWSLVIVGPVVKIDPASLPQRDNIFYLGAKTYAELPDYLSHWDVALLPFAVNEATRFISPTKTPEYLASGRPAVSTPIRDVDRHYGALKGVFIGEGAAAFIAGCAAALEIRKTHPDWLEQADAALADLSWDETHARMAALVQTAAAPPTGAMAATVETAARPTMRASTRAKPFDVLVVGAGFAGAVLAERLAEGLGKRVLVIDRRPHIGGNAYDERNAAGVLMHRYGPHIFHTNSDEVAGYLSQFTRWRPYEHRVLADLGGGLRTPMPINRTTLNLLYKLNLSSDAEAEAFLAQRAEPVERIRTSEDVVISKVGRDLYERFFRGYTRKQWGLDPSELDRSVTARVPTRVDTDDRYFTDTFQAMPADGYTRMFENMLDHENITVETSVDFEDIQGDVIYDQLIFTGPIDEYFDQRFGALPYRSLLFRHETLDQEWFQPVGTVNYPDEKTPYTRISEYKHLTGQSHAKTTITYEYPKAEGDPYYPIPRPENQALFKRYEALALGSKTKFVGRLATYRYYNMDQVVAQALATYRRIAEAEDRKASVTRATATAAAE
jgi:UDP-galactopyranose mutase